MEELNAAQRLAIWALPVLFAITVHEVAHGWVARYFGDPTAMQLGRLTLNPIKHIDPVGTLLVPGLLLLMGGFLFGWAKPVPVNEDNLRNPKRDMALVALAGPMANLLMALFWAVVMKLGITLSAAGSTWLGHPMFLMGGAGISINLILMLLNLLPLPPLDGSKIISGMIPTPWAAQLDRLEPYGFLILLALLVTNVLGAILGPPLQILEATLFALVRL